MNLPGIIGSGQTESLIILYSFIQQNLLFEAFAGLRGINTGIGFLSYLATIFSMIGLLILIFSPSLWKLKYAGCWFALFIIVNLGGSVGPEFGYTFNKLVSYGQGSQPIVAQNEYKCGPTANNGAGGCQQLYAGDQILADNQQAVLGDVESVGMRMQKNTNDVTNGQGERMVGVAADGSFNDLNIVGFFPQVVILYITNTLRDALQEAMNELVEADDLAKMASVADLMVNAQIPNEQVKLMTKAFNDICGGVDDKKATDILSMIPAEQAKYKSELASRTFTPNDVLHLSSLVNKDKNPKQLEPLMMFPEYNADGTTLNELTLEFMTDPAYDLFKKAYVLNRTSDDNVSITKDEASDLLKNNQPLYKTFDGMDEEYIKSELYNGSVYETKYNEDQKKLKEQTAKFLKSKYASLPVKMMMPTYDLPKSEVEQYADKQAEKRQSSWASAGGCGNADSCKQLSDSKKLKYDTSKQLLGNLSKGNFREITDCDSLMNEQSNALDLAVRKNLDDLPDQLRYHTQKQLAHTATQSGYWGSVDTRQDGEDVETAKALSTEGSIPKEMMTSLSLSNVLSEEQMKCVLKPGSAPNCDQIQKKIDRYVALYKQSAIQNATAVPADSRVNIGYQDDSAAGLANAITKGFVDVATGPVSWFAEIGASIKAGAYAAVLPIIKNIIIAFILVLTPILLLMGLLVPAWAPGVIMTVLVALLYIKMVDVTMVLMDGILSITKDIFENIYNGGNAFSDANPLNKAYLNFLDTIWAMAYMSSFLITAFLMFAAGNTKQIMGKLSGMDGTVKGVGNDVLNTGIKGVAMAGSAIAGAPALAGKVAAYSKLADEKGNMAALDAALGTVSGSYAKAQNKQYNSMRSSLQEDKEALQNISTVTKGDKTEATRMSIMADDKHGGADRSRDIALENTGYSMTPDEKADKAFISKANKRIEMDKQIISSKKYDAKHLKNSTITDRITGESYEIKGTAKYMATMYDDVAELSHNERDVLARLSAHEGKNLLEYVDVTASNQKKLGLEDYAVGSRLSKINKNGLENVLNNSGLSKDKQDAIREKLYNGKIPKDSNKNDMFNVTQNGVKATKDFIYQDNIIPSSMVNSRKPSSRVKGANQSSKSSEIRDMLNKRK
tara:strand:- start:383 stop:3757 length:3375 start_codon:yes stop_codon:yes gene_type:complete